MDDIPLVTKILSETGSIIYFNEPILKKYAFLDPQWLIDCINVLLQHDLVQDGKSIVLSSKEYSLSNRNSGLQLHSYYLATATDY